MPIFTRRLFGALSIGGAAIGFIALSKMFAQSSGFWFYFFMLLGVGFFVWGLWCGIQLLENQPKAIQLNQVYWALQIPVFMSPIFGISIASGAFLNVWINFTNINFGINWYLGSLYNFSFLQFAQPFILGINLFALLVFMYLNWISKTIQAYQESQSPIPQTEATENSDTQDSETGETT